MELKINGSNKTFEQNSASVTELLSLENIDMPEMVSVELNGEILDRENFDKTTVKTGDEVAHPANRRAEIKAIK